MKNALNAALALALVASAPAKDLIVTQAADVLPTAPATNIGRTVAVSGITALVGVRDGDNLGAAHVYLQIGSDWRQVAALEGSDTLSGDIFGDSVAIDSDLAVVGAPQHDGVAANTGAVYVFERVGVSWNEVAKLTASDAASGDLFGKAVAIQGETIAVGATYDDDGASNAGSVYVFTRVAGAWGQRAKLTSSLPAVSAHLGRSLAIDGATILAGAHEDRIAGEAWGTAYVFVGGGAVWTQQARLFAPDGAAYDLFGLDVAIDGDTALVGAQEADEGAPHTGAAHVFVRGGTTWFYQAKLTADVPDDHSDFGHALALEGDVAFISQYQAGPGAVHRFQRDHLGNWSRTLTLTDPGGEAGDLFGGDVALDGTALLVGAYRDDAPGETDGGTVFVYTDDGPGWTLADRIHARGPADGAFFGLSVALDGDTFLCGAPIEDEIGAAYVFTYDGTAWSEQARLAPIDGADDDRFGYAVAVEGDRALVGAHFHADTGAVYVFERSGTSWTQTAKLTASDTFLDQLFGWRIALDGGRAAIAAPDATELGPGSVYVFEGGGTSWTETAKLGAADGAAADFFGTNVALEGACVMVGAYAHVGGTGAVYEFTYDGFGWAQTAKVQAPGAAPGQGFGESVALSDQRLIVGAAYVNVSETARGVADVFVRDGPSWAHEARFAPTGPNLIIDFGGAVALDGERALVGARFAHAPGASSGELFLFARSPTGWTQQQRFTASETRAGDDLGYAVALADDTLVGGALGHDRYGGSNNGAAYVFAVSGSATSFCDESDSALAWCPCNNPGDADTGCELPQATGGVRLDILAQTTSPNGATLQGTGFPGMSSPTAIVIRSDALDAGGPTSFGDGVRCVATSPLVRLAAVSASGGTSTHAFGHSAMAGSGSFYYQLWFRSTPSTYCVADAAFNLSSGQTLTWP